MEPDGCAKHWDELTPCNGDSLEITTVEKECEEWTCSAVDGAACPLPREVTERAFPACKSAKVGALRL